MKVPQSYTTFCNPMASLSMGFSRQEYWSGLPFSSPGDLPDPGVEPRSPAQILYLWGEDKREIWGIKYYILKHSSFLRFLVCRYKWGHILKKSSGFSVSWPILSHLPGSLKASARYFSEEEGGYHSSVPSWTPSPPSGVLLWSHLGAPVTVTLAWH